MLDSSICHGLQANIINNYDLLKKHESRIGYDLDKALKTNSCREFI